MSDQAVTTPSLTTRSIRPAQALRTLFVRLPTLLLLIVLIVVFSLASPNFLTSANVTSVIGAQAVIACVTFAAVIPLLAGEFDLSLGYMAGLLMAVGAYLGAQGLAPVLVLAAMIAAGAFIGLVNGLLTVRFQISAFIATLGVGIILSSFTQAITGGQVLFQGIPPIITSLGQDRFLGLAISAWCVLVIAAALVYLLEHTPLGRRWYAVGGSERVAFLAGVRTGRLKILAFVVAGILVGIAAIFQLGQAGAASPSFGPELLLPAYAGAFLGVVAYRPGFFNIPGALIAILVLGVGFNGLSLLGIPSWGQPLFNGAVLLVAVLGAKAESRHVKVG